MNKMQEARLRRNAQRRVTWLESITSRNRPEGLRQLILEAVCRFSTCEAYERLLKEKARK